MDFQGIKTYAEGCLRDAPPPCVSVCPLGIDVRGLVSKVREGSIGAAYRAYREAVLFPRTVSAFCEAPCKTVCVRERLSDGPVHLAAIEREIVSEAGESSVDQRRYIVSKNTERVAVLGGGLAGLACVFKLASKGYAVTLFGAPLSQDEHLDRLLAEDIDELFLNIEYELRNEDCPSQNEEFDAVYDSRTVLEEGVAYRIASGIKAAAVIEERLRIGGLSGKGPAERGFIVTKKDVIREKPAINEGFYELEYDFTLGRNDTEADRCPVCNCSACIDKCAMIRWFRQNPKRIAADLGVSVLPVGGKIKRVGSRMINSCNLCGLCTSVCPVGVDTCAAIEASRGILKESGHLAPVFHEFWMEDLAFSMSEEAYGVVFTESASGKTAPLLFFPGCQLSASLPDTVAGAFDFIAGSEPGAAMLLGCCGIPADWAAEKDVFNECITKIRADWESLGKPEVLFACSACKKTFEKALPEVKGRLVYELFALNEFTILDKAGKAAVYDPCNSRGDTEGQAAVRVIAEKCGYRLEELELSLEEAACCGFGGHIYPANPGLLEMILSERAEDAPGILRLTYCANCRDLFLSGGMDAAHILEILFQDARGRVPTLSERRENRRELKSRFAAGQKYDEPSDILVIADGVEAKMDRLLLLRKDVERTVRYCEENSAKVIDTATGRFIGCCRDRLLTVWAEYSIGEDDRAYIFNVYTHRMKIESDGRAGEVSKNDNQGTLVCVKCGIPLSEAQAKFSYLGHEFAHTLPVCEECGLVYVPEALATGKIAEVEATLEDK